MASKLAGFGYRQPRQMFRAATPQEATAPTKPKTKPIPTADVAPSSAPEAAAPANACLRTAPKSERLAAAKKLASAVIDRGASAAKRGADTTVSVANSATSIKTPSSESAKPTDSVGDVDAKHKRFIGDPANVALNAGLKRTETSGARFAELIGRPVRSVEEWMRGESKPTPEALVVLDMIEHCAPARDRLEAQHPKQPAKPRGRPFAKSTKQTTSA
jgi:hypothetical protein